MCDDGFDAEPCAVWREVRRRARKIHQCWACSQAIAPGHRYQVSTVVWDGTAQTWKHCLRCAHLLGLLKARLGSYTTEIFDLDCGVVWEDPPPDIAQLAFMTSADSQMLEAT